MRNWILLLLGCVLALGMIFPEQSTSIRFAVPKDLIIAAVLLAMSLPLEFDAMWNSLRRPGPSLLTTFICFVVVPLLAWPISLCFQTDLAAGLIIASAVPCSMASVTVWTRLAGGNEAGLKITSGSLPNPPETVTCSSDYRHLCATASDLLNASAISCILKNCEGTVGAITFFSIRIAPLRRQDETIIRSTTLHLARGRAIGAAANARRSADHFRIHGQQQRYAVRWVWSGI
jgi:hypothetical protein